MVLVCVKALGKTPTGKETRVGLVTRCLKQVEVENLPPSVVKQMEKLAPKNEPPVAKPKEIPAPSVCPAPKATPKVLKPPSMVVSS